MTCIPHCKYSPLSYSVFNFFFREMFFASDGVACKKYEIVSESCFKASFCQRFFAHFFIINNFIFAYSVMLPYTPATCSPCSPREKFSRVNDSVDYFRVTNYYGVPCTNKVSRIAVHAGRVVHVFGFVVQSSSICLRVAC